MQLLDGIDDVTNEIQCGESTEHANSMDEFHEIVEEFQEPLTD